MSVQPGEGHSQPPEERLARLERDYHYLLQHLDRHHRRLDQRLRRLEERLSRLEELFAEAARQTE